jgi:hypothetical protein
MPGFLPLFPGGFGEKTEFITKMLKKPRLSIYIPEKYGIISCDAVCFDGKTERSTGTHADATKEI